MRIGILLYRDVDLLDAGGPYEVFLTASRLARRGGRPPPFEVVTIGAGSGPPGAYGGLGLAPHTSAGEAGSLDVLVVPGMIEIDRALADGVLVETVARLAAGAALTSSVCTGAFLLAEAGLLTGRPWTTHWEDIDLLAERYGLPGGVRGVRWVDDGPIVTGAGLSSGIAMALHLVDRLAGRALAERTARQIDHSWDPSGAGAAA